jgi:hypothetical protein
MNLLSVDPGTHYTGYAWWDTTHTHITLLKYGLIRATGDDWKKRVYNIKQGIQENFPEFKSVVVELPEFHAGARGMNASRQGDTLMLAVLCGALMTGSTYFVTPSQWKGQLSKQITAIRMLQYWPELGVKQKIDYNWADAVMLGVMTSNREVGSSVPVRVDL